MDLLPTVNPALLAADSPATVLGSALLMGLSGGFHCFLMCGPLACAATPLVPLRVSGEVRTQSSRATPAFAAYHGARLTAYAVLGGLLGLFGSAFSTGFALPIRAVLPWVLVAALVASAFDWGKRLAPIPGFANIVQRATRIAASFSPTLRAGLIGGITPLLPCGLLYGLFAVAFTAASFGGGALLLGAFALGGAPSLLAAQLAARLPGLAGVRQRMGGLPAQVVRRGLPLVAAALIAWRAVQAARGEDCH